MPAACRLGDRDSAGAAIVGNVASTVTINGQPAALVGSAQAPHGKSIHRGSTVTVGSPTVIVENRALARVTSGTACGHAMATGSPNVDVI
jgi:uncharacterized Zn-binding protein involved in type VI secretion